MNCFKKYCFSVILLITLVVSASAQDKNTLKGTVTNQKEEKGVQYANIRIKDSPYGTTSDEAGKFEFSFPNQFLKGSHYLLPFANFRIFRRFYP